MNEKNAELLKNTINTLIDGNITPAETVAVTAIIKIAPIEWVLKLEDCLAWYQLVDEDTPQDAAEYKIYLAIKERTAPVHQAASAAASAVPPSQRIGAWWEAGRTV